MVRTEVRMRIKPKNFVGDEEIDYRKEVQLQPGRNRIKLVRTLYKPQLWWTWDFGKPNLYLAEFSVGGEDPHDGITESFGIKQIEKDDKGQWYLNGKRIFLRGMRYLSSLWISEIDEAQYADDLDRMLDMKINSIRLGSHVELPIFYDMCDEMGFLLWQVFPLHYCYSDSDELIEKAAPMMAEMVSMLHNHASMGMWSVFKEPKIYGLPNKPNNYGRLCQIMYEAARTVDPIRWVHTGDYEEGVQNLMIGGVQPGDMDMKRVQVRPQIVEFGAASIPVLETLKTFIPEDKLWPPDWDTWEYWGLFYNLIFNFAQVEMGNSLEEFIDNSQVYEARVIKEQIEFFRQRKYTPVASMYLYYWNDACACIGSGLLDYYRRPYKAYESMKAVYTPVLVSLEWNKDPYVIGYEKLWYPGEQFVGKVWAVNDHDGCLEGATVSWQLISLADGRTILQGEKQLDIAADSAQVVDQVLYKVERGMQGKYQVQMKIADNQGSLLSHNYFDLTFG
jgi:beta-mannosidase